MGAWSRDRFGNDTACDWAYGLEEVSDLSLVRSTMHKFEAGQVSVLDLKTRASKQV
jgi:hypothetical protein